MDFYKLIQSLDELVYEVLSWLLFYPITLTRVVLHPIRSMLSAERELKEDEAHSFDDMLGPPLFLFLTILIIHFIELWLNPAGSDELIKSHTGISAFITNDTNVIVFRVLTFGLLPLTAARRLLKIRGIRLDKNRLRAPFYSQCYACAIDAILFAAASFLLTFKFPHAQVAATAVFGVAIVWFLVVEGRWFMVKQNQSLLSGLGNAFVVWVEWLLIVGVLLLLLR